MKNNSIDMKSLLIGFLFAALLFTTLGATIIAKERDAYGEKVTAAILTHAGIVANAATKPVYDQYRSYLNYTRNEK
ncbi:MAG TPA: hypothetical protein EYQ50_05240 [Verrucomicrobiales bacterium]|jgi:hypothetical protein|nr:hypothetical protein [Verrucomicrobiales bacterium]HIL71628.1 hypothetical protein [Verrucomicrobiota bacterium]